MNPLLIGPIFEIGSKIIDKFFPDTAEADKKGSIVKINADAVLTSFEGKAILAVDGKSDATLKGIAVMSLMTMIDADKGMQGDEKLKLYELACKVNAGGDVELSPEEAALIKKRIGLMFGPAVVGPAFKILNG